MKYYDYTVKKTHHEHMRQRQIQNRSKGMTKAEKWFYENYLNQTNMTWTFQARWGWRLFDFWNHKKGIAIEVDGPEHNKFKDLIKDEIEIKRSAIITIRVKNFDSDSSMRAIEKIISEKDWNTRRMQAGLKSIKNC